MKRHLDNASTATLVVTLVLFAIALFTTGFTHDLLLEAGVFLVSVKLILAHYRHDYHSQEITRRLDQIQAQLNRLGHLDDKELARLVKERRDEPSIGVSLKEL